MNIFLLDDSDVLGRYISKVQPVGSDCKVFCVDPSYYGSKESLDDFFHAILNKKAWRMAGNVQGEESQSLKSLMGNASEKCLFLIYVNLKPTKFSIRQDQEGIELLKHIRLTDKDELGEGRNAHVVLYSFEEQLTLLQRKPGNLIMLSEGVTFLRLPDGLNTMATPAELVKLADKRADVDRKDFKRFVQCDYQPPDSAHQFSNWWGLRQIALARNADMPATVVQKLGLLQNKKTRFLFDHRDLHIGNNPCLSLPPGSFQVVYIDDEAEWGNCLGSALRHDLGMNVSVDYLQPPSLEIFSDDTKLEEWTAKYVLSKANSGTPRRLSNLADLRSLASVAMSLVLLDLRLLGASESNVPVDDASGMKIARTIRKLDPGLPIVLMTASNKAYTFEAAMKNGIDGYWMKEGVGEHAPQAGTRENYIQLLTMICSALSAEYQFLRRFSRKVSELEKVNSSQRWWEQWSWQSPSGTEVTSTKTEDIFTLLYGILVLLREYLRLFKMGYGFKGEKDAIRQSWLSSLIVEAIKVLELIHRLDLKLEYDNRFAVLLGRNGRQDRWGALFNAQRRHAAHVQGGKKLLEFVHVQSVLSGILTHLMFSPTHNQRSKDIYLVPDYIALHGDSKFYRVSED